MKKTNSLLLVVAMGLVLSACNITPPSSEADPSETAESSSNESSAPTESVAVMDVLDNISDPLAITGTLSSVTKFDSESYPRGTYGVECVLADSYYYSCHTDLDYEEQMKARYENDDGKIAVESLNPVTNQSAMQYAVDEEGNPISFKSFFHNPFASADGLGIENGKVVLKDASKFDTVGLAYLVGSANFIRGLLSVDTLTIDYDASLHPTAFAFTMTDHSYEEYGETTAYEFAGSFVEASSISVSERATPRTAQPGSEKLQAMFDRLKEGNYTVEIALSFDYGEEEYAAYAEEEEEEEEDNTIIGRSYICEDGFYTEYENYWLDPNGIHMTDEGWTPFKAVMNEDGEYDGYKDSSKAMPVRGPEYYFGDCFSYSAASFDVMEDGTFVLASVPGFADLAHTYLLPDSHILSVCFPDEGSLTFAINEEEDYLAYTYSGYDGSECYTVKISNIGTTTLPLDVSTIDAYTPIANWTEYGESNNWNKDCCTNLDLLTAGHKDDLPFVDSPYNYVRSINNEAEFIFDEEDPWSFPEEIPYYTYFVNTHYEFDTAAESQAAKAELVAQMEGDSKFVHNEEDDTYTYTNEDGANVLVRLTVEEDVSVWDEHFDYGLYVEFINNVPFEGGEGGDVIIL